MKNKMIQDLKKIKEIYDSGGNIISQLKLSNDAKNLSEMIKISYDLQAGAYSRKAELNPEFEEERAITFSQIINGLGEFNSILEVGIGEATSFSCLIPKLRNKNIQSFGFDISYSRIQYGNKFLKKTNLSNKLLFTGSYFDCPIQDSAIDIVYTVHSLEPNGGQEKKMLEELFRITSKYLVLFEPIYELSSEKSKSHMDNHGYVRNLYSTAIQLGYKVKEYKLIFEENCFGDNSTGVIIIDKTDSTSNDSNNLSPLACPITKEPLELIKNNYYCQNSMLLYPVVNSIPCLLPENAIIATHYLD